MKYELLDCQAGLWYEPGKVMGVYLVLAVIRSIVHIPRQFDWFYLLYNNLQRNQNRSFSRSLPYPNYQN